MSDGENNVVLRRRGTTEWGPLLLYIGKSSHIMLEPRPTGSERRRIFLGAQSRQQERHRQKITANKAFWRNNNKARLAEVTIQSGKGLEVRLEW